MSKKCPYCGSYNTEVSVSRQVGRCLLNIGRCALAIGANVCASAFNPSAGHAASHSVWRGTDPGDLKGHKCCNCGKYFSA